LQLGRILEKGITSDHFQVVDVTFRWVGVIIRWWQFLCVRVILHYTGRRRHAGRGKHVVTGHWDIAISARLRNTAVSSG